MDMSCMHRIKCTAKYPPPTFHAFLFREPLILSYLLQVPDLLKPLDGQVVEFLSLAPVFTLWKELQVGIVTIQSFFISLFLSRRHTVFSIYTYASICFTRLRSALEEPGNLSII